MTQYPRLYDFIKYQAIEITAPAHRDTAVREKTHTSRDVFSNRDIKGTATKVVHEKDPVSLSVPHHAHHGGNWLLHERDLPKASGFCGRHCCVFLHLIECGWDSNDGGRLAAIA